MRFEKCQIYKEWTCLSLFFSKVFRFKEIKYQILKIESITWEKEHLKQFHGKGTS